MILFGWCVSWIGNPQSRNFLPLAAARFADYTISSIICKVSTENGEVESKKHKQHKEQKDVNMKS